MLPQESGHGDTPLDQTDGAKEATIARVLKGQEHDLLLIDSAKIYQGRKLRLQYDPLEGKFLTTATDADDLLVNG